MSYCPLRYAQDNVVFGHTGLAGAVYRLPTVSYSMLSAPDKDAWMLLLCGLALRARADFSIHRVTRRYPASDYVPQAMGFVDARYQTPEAWRSMLEGHEPCIEKLAAYATETYMRISLEKPTNARGVIRTVDRAARRINEWAGVSAEAPLMQPDLDELHRKQSLVLDRTRDALPDIRPITLRELQWLCMRNAVAHVDEPLCDPAWQPDALVVHTDKGLAFKPRASDMRCLFSAAVTRQTDHVVVVAEGQGGTCVSYQATVVLGKLPHDGITFPGLTAEMMFAPLDNLAFAVDATLHCEWVTNQRALAEVRRKLMVAEERIDEAFKAARTPDHRTMLTPDLAREVEQILMHESRPPMFDATCLYRVSASSLDELNQRVELLREQFPIVATHRPPGEQERLWRAHLLHPSLVVTDWAQRLTLDQFGMMMPIAAREIGDTHGVYIAYTTQGAIRTPVKIDPGRPSRDAFGDTWYLTGRQGSGKTVTAMLLAALAGMRGSTVLTANAKLDHHITKLPEFAGESAVVSLSADHETDRGKLDPLVAAPDQVQETVALSYYKDLLPDINHAGQRALMDAIKVARKEGSGSLGVINVLLAGDAIASEVGRDLELFSDFGLGRLGFSDGTSNHDRDQIARITTFTMADLGLPDATMERGDYDDRQRIAVATFKLLVAHIMGVVARDPRDHKVVVLDEAWVFDGSDGQQLLNQIARLLRSLNGTLLICSQTVSDLGKVKDLINMFLIGGVNNVQEAAKALSLIGLDPDNTSLCAALANRNVFCKGLMLFRDSDGHVEVVQIDQVFDHWLKTFDTRPQTGAPEAVPA